MKYILSVDQGTTSSRAIIFDENQKVIAESQREYELSYPKDGWVEANVLDLGTTSGCHEDDPSAQARASRPPLASILA